jgi:hypothetical protein
LTEAPSPRTRNRASGWTRERQAVFLDALAEVGSAERAAVRVGLSASSAFRLRRQPRGAAFAAAWDTVISTRTAQLTEELLVRVSGTPEPVCYRGRVIGEKVVASNRILVGVLARTLAQQRAAATDPEAVYFAARARLNAH